MRLPLCREIPISLLFASVSRIKLFLLLAWFLFPACQSSQGLNPVLSSFYRYCYNKRAKIHRVVKTPIKTGRCCCSSTGITEWNLWWTHFPNEKRVMVGEQWEAADGAACNCEEGNNKNSPELGTMEKSDFCLSLLVDDRTRESWFFSWCHKYQWAFNYLSY